MKKLMIIFIFWILVCTGCYHQEKDRVIIYSCLESFRNKTILENLEKALPDIKISLESLSTGKLAAKLKSEGTNTEGDIILGLDAAYAESLKDNFQPLTNYDNDHYIEEFQITGKSYAVWERFGGCTVANGSYLRENGLDIPKSYEDLLNPGYKNKIAMPDPKSSATGYLFLKNLVNVMGETEALNYFDQLTENITFFTASGSGPVNLLIQGEVGIGLGLTFHAVQEINRGMDFEIIFFEEGSPYNTSVMAMLKERENQAEVEAVFDYLYDQGIKNDKALYSPEKVFKIQENNILNYPKEIPYGDMKGINNIEEKEAILDLWKY